MSTNSLRNPDVLQNVDVQPRFRTNASTIVPAHLPVHACQGLTHPPKEGSSVCKCFRSAIDFTNTYTERSQLPNTGVQNVCLIRNVRRRLTMGAATMSANVSSASTNDNETLLVRQMIVEATIPVIRIFDRFRALHTTSFQSNSMLHAGISPIIHRHTVSTPINQNTMWQHVKNRIVRPPIINLPSIQEGVTSSPVGHHHVVGETVVNQVSIAMNP
ncbi:hypothetical protein Tco_0038936 [Tanacetum coccineum]